MTTPHTEQPAEGPDDDERTGQDAPAPAEARSSDDASDGTGSNDTGPPAV